MSITETVLEMHYHSAILEKIKSELGLGKGTFNFYKYSTSRECFVGFDQAFVQSNLSPENMFKLLKDSALNNGYSLNNFFLGMFFQFKVVQECRRKSTWTPSTIKSSPHYRVKLDTVKNMNTGVSQHELLYNLNQNNTGSYVYYACPMLFEQHELYAIPDLRTLRLADLKTCPSMYTDNERHFIYFEQQNSVPIWCSDPTEGKGISVDELIVDLQQKLVSEGFKGNQEKLLDWLNEPVEENSKEKRFECLSESLVIIHFSSVVD
ncbi:hypothetical protein ACOISO_003782 [Vibrio fluvialis]|nr:hypothetical protein [Vibrio fluvialis]